MRYIVYGWGQGCLSPNTLEQVPPLLPHPLEVGPPYCGYGVWGSALAPPAGPGRARPTNGIW